MLTVEGNLNNYCYYFYRKPLSHCNCFGNIYRSSCYNSSLGGMLLLNLLVSIQDNHNECLIEMEERVVFMAVL